MIKLENISKAYKLKNGRNHVLKDLSYIFKPGLNVGILGRNGAGKSTLLRIIGGTELPDSGRVIRESNISWPIGLAHGFHGALTGRENLRFISRIYGANIKKVTAFVEEFTALGSYLDMPLSTYSSGMGAKLAFGLSMAIDFDFYLVDEVTAVGDVSFRERCQKAFEERKATSTLIVVSHSLNTIKSHCDIALVLDNGQLHPYTSIDEAAVHYDRICKNAACLPFDPVPQNSAASNMTRLATH